MALAARIKLGPYEIVAPLGAVGMGEVYRARDLRLARRVSSDGKWVFAALGEGDAEIVQMDGLLK
jgi:hypothetical protein